MNAEKAMKIQRYYDYFRLTVVLLTIGTLILLTL